MGWELSSRWRWGAVVVWLAACGKGGGKDEPPATRSAEDAATAVAVAVEDAAPPPPPDARVSLTGVPPLTMTPPSAEDGKRAVALNNQALPLHRAGKKDPKPLAEAIALYEQAVTANPAYLIARYNLASALSTGGQADRALALLAELRDFAAVSPCDKCHERLARARNDAEWKPLWNDPRFVEITKANTGPPAKVLMYAQVTACDYEAAEPGISMQILLEPPPGFARMPALEAVATRKGKALATWTPSDLEAEQCVRFPKVEGKADVTLTVDGRAFATLKVDTAAEGYGEVAFHQGAIRHPDVARCDALECPSFPAVSPDGKFVVTRESEELISPGDQCHPPIGERTRYYSVTNQGLEEVGSLDLSSYEPLGCEADDKLLDGYTAVVGDDRVAIEDPHGKTVGKIDGLNDVPRVCASTKHRFVLVSSFSGVGGDCQEIGVDEYEALRY